MDLKEKFNRMKSFAPIFSVILVAACVAGSLRGYEPAIYAAEEPQEAVTDTETVVETEETEQMEKGSFELEDGVYMGTGTGFAGDITVSVQMKEKQIVSVEILSTSDDEAFFNRAKAVIDRMIESQTLDVDTVSGATYSSKGIISAVKNALTGEKDNNKTGKTKTAGKISVTTANDPSSYKDGTYYGTGTGFGGKLKVQVDISGGKITSIQILETKDGSTYIAKASSLINAIIANQSTNVDTVSGATYSSAGIIEAVRNALRQAAGEPEDAAETVVKGSFELADGIYKGEGTGYGGTTKVSVQIENKQIAAINILSTSDDAAFFNRAKNVIDQIMEKQTLTVDTVSGATYSSRGIINAVKNALTGEKDYSQTGKSQSGGNPASGSSSTVSSVEEAAAYKDGTYYGTGTGFGGQMKVQVDIKDGKITAIQILEHSDGNDYISSASSLIDTIISRQSTNVDTVSGASYSSAGIIQAVRNALSQAATEKSEDDNKTEEEPVTGTIPYNEGIYYGTAEGYSGDVSVAVVIQDYTIKAILVTDTSDDESFFNRAMDVVKNIVKKQSTEVDTVSGATYSSNGLINAVKSALEKAEKVTNGDSIEEKPDVSALSEVISQAEQLVETEYTISSWTVLKIRLEDAREAMEDESQAVIDKALQKLKLAITALVKVDSGDDADDSTYIDGEYPVTVTCVPDADEDFEAYELSMKVTIRNDKIVDVTEVSGNGDSANDSYIKKAVNGTSTKAGVVAQIINKGLPEEIDTVSRATCSSNAIIEGCKKALEAAKRPEKTENE